MGFCNKVFTLSYNKREGRIDIFDFLRGLAMLFVLLQHAGFPGYRLLLEFHMPLFFFLSGMVSGDRELPCFGRYVFSRFKRLMIPYFSFGIIDVLFFKTVDLIQGIQYDLPRAFWGLLTGQYGFSPPHQGGIYWFFITLFIAELLIYPINKFFKKSRLSLLIGVVLFASLSFLSTHGHPMPLFSLEKSFMAAAFLLMGGALCRPIKTILFDEKFHLWEVGMILAGLLGLVISLKMNNKPVLMYLNEYGNYGWFFLGALSGILFSVIAGKHLFLMLRTDVKFVYYKLMMWMGFNSLVLFPIHILINVWIEKLCSVLGIGCFPLNLIAMFAFGIPICNLITYYFPWLLGQRKQY